MKSVRKNIIIIEERRLYLIFIYGGHKEFLYFIPERFYSSSASFFGGIS